MAKRTGTKRAKKPSARRRPRIDAVQALRDSEARFRSLTHLSSDWYWEQDREFRFTRMEGRHVTGGDLTLRHRLIGMRRWESGLEVEGGWEAHRALLAERRQFFDVLMWRARKDGTTRYLRVSGEPVFGADGSFTGYRGVGRDVSAEKRDEELLRLEHQVARALSQASDQASGVRAVLQAVCESEGWACGRYYALDEQAGVLRFSSAWCVADPVLERFVDASRPLSFRPGDGLAGKVLQTGDAIWSSDAANDLRVSARKLYLEAAIRGAFCAPVVSEGRCIGVLSFSSQSLRQPDLRLLQAARIIGSQVGQFLQRMRAEAALRESEARFRSLTELSSDFFWETDEAHRFTQLVHGRNFSAQFGAAIIGRCAWDLAYASPPEQAWADLRASLDARKAFRDFEFGRPRATGASVYFSVSGEPRHDAAGRFIGYRGVGRDVTDLVLAREHIASLAYSDPLTGLANRTSLLPAFEQAVERARRRGTRLAALFVDLDGFKAVNDAHGHQAGDRFLVEIGRRLRAALRASDLVARLGGDEFFAVLEDVQDQRQVEIVGRKLLDEILRPFEVAPGAQGHASGSLGIAMFPDHATDAASLMKQADQAMYAAKQSGKNALRVHAPAGRAAGSPP